MDNYILIAVGISSLAVIVGLLLAILWRLGATAGRRSANSHTLGPMERTQSRELTDSDSAAQATRPQKIYWHAGQPTKPLVEIGILNEPIPASSSPIELNPGLRIHMQALLHQAPNLLYSGAHMAQGTTYVLRFSPEVARQLATGSACMMASTSIPGGLRAVAVASDGAIIGQGTLVATSAMAGVTAALAVWQVLAIITAQKYLTDINARLENMRTGIDAIKEWLTNERVGTLLAFRKNLEEIANELSCNESANLERLLNLQRLEQIDHESRSIAEAAFLEIRDCVQKCRSVKWRFTSDEEAVRAEAIDVIDNYRRNCMHYVYSLYVRSLGEQIRCAFAELESPSAIRRLERISGDLLRAGEETERLANEIIEHLPELSGLITSGSTDAKTRREIREHLTEASGRINATVESVNQGVAVLQIPAQRT